MNKSPNKFPNAGCSKVTSFPLDDVSFEGVFSTFSVFNSFSSFVSLETLRLFLSSFLLCATSLLSIGLISSKLTTSYITGANPVSSTGLASYLSNS